MSDVRFMATEKDPASNGSASVLCLRTWKELRVPAAYRDMPETSTSAARSAGRQETVDQGQMTSIDQQLEMLDALATRHYPDNEGEKNACLVRLLTERLRQYAALYQSLPVREMSDE